MADMNWNEGQTEQAVEQPAPVVEQPAAAPTYVPPAEPKKKNTWKWVLLVVSILAILSLIGCGLVSCLGLALWGADTESTTLEDSKYPNDNDLIAIEEGTTVELTAEEQAYVDFVRQNVTAFNPAIQALQGRAQAWADSGFALGDDVGWLKDVSADLDAVRAVAHQFVDADPANIPPRFSEAHALYVAAMKDYLTATDHLQGAIDGNNEEALVKYTDYASAASDKIIEAHIAFATARDGVAPDLSGLQGE